MIVFWDVAPFSPVEIDRRFRGVYCLHRQAVISAFHCINLDNKYLLISLFHKS
jgi:hypothetical protein